MDLEALWRAESGRVLATLIRLLGSFELAEEALHEAFVAAAEQWPRQGMPRNPRAWLVSAGRFRTIDRLRRRRRHDELLATLPQEEEAMEATEEHEIADDQLRLIFTCCHPALPAEQQVALTLREVCGLTTEAIAQAFLVPPPTLAQRIVRAKGRIKSAALPYEVPERAELPARLYPVLATVYLVFNEGYSAHAGALAGEAIRLGRLLVALLPDPEAVGLLALMLLQDSRRAARLNPDGDLVLIADQDRGLWDRREIAEGLALAERAMAGPEVGQYGLQAAIAAVHARAPDDGATDWAEIVRLYDMLAIAVPSPVVALNRAVAIAMRDGPEAALPLLTELAEGQLKGYALAHAARADLLRRLGRTTPAHAAYARALELTTGEPERRFLERRLAQAGG